MKRVVCLLLCAVLLMGLLPAAALANDEQQMYFEICRENGVVSDATRWPGVGSMYGDSIFFRAYTAETGGEAITGDQLCLYENNKPDTNGMLTWIPSGNNGYYKWDTHAAKAADPVFLATIDGQKYKGRAQVHEAEVGWFSSRDKSISTALTYGFATDANVYYDGTKDVTVYLTADFSFSTIISETSIIEKTDGIEYALEDRGYNEGIKLGNRLKVTCKAPWSGNLGLKVRVTQQYIFGGEPQDVIYAVTFSEDGKKTGEEGQSRPGEPTAIKVKITDKEGRVNEETCWFGVGEYANNKYDILSGSSMGSPINDTNFAILAVGLWWKDERSDGTWDLTMLSKEEAEQVMEQAEFHLEFHAQSGQEATPKGLTPGEIKERYGYEDLIRAVDAAAALGMPEAACYPLEAQHEGKWRVEAVCTMKESRETYTACGNLERRVINNINLNACTTVTEINDKLKDTFNHLPNSSKWRETNIRVWLREPEYTGQIVVPDIPDGYMEVSVEFVGDIWNGTGTPVVKLHGGICSDSAPIAVQNIRFIGAGKQDPEGINSEYLEYWPRNDEHNGAENSALYGLAAATAARCSFTGYYYAMKLTKEMRLCGENNTYVENHIAWYLGEGIYNGGNPKANNCVFKGNDIAIQIEKFNLRPSFYAPSRCQFIDNTFDILNHSGRAWFIPGNYFEHDGKRATANDPATSIGFYPMIRTEQTGDAYYWDGEWLPTNRLLLSNSLTGAYPTPQTYLDGKTFEVVDDRGDADETLAIFSFPAAQQSAASRSIALFSGGQPSVLTADAFNADAFNADAFNASVSVERTQTQIRFFMNDPCKTVTVKIPCTFRAGTVTRNGDPLTGATFDGQFVSFDTNERGLYIISYTKPAYIFAAGYDSAGKLVGVQALASEQDPISIPGADKTKLFLLDEHYRPLASPQ